MTTTADKMTIDEYAGRVGYLAAETCAQDDIFGLLSTFGDHMLKRLPTLSEQDIAELAHFAAEHEWRLAELYEPHADDIRAKGYAPAEYDKVRFHEVYLKGFEDGYKDSLQAIKDGKLTRDGPSN